MQVFKFPTPDRLEMIKRSSQRNEAVLEANRLCAAVNQHGDECMKLIKQIRKYRKALDQKPNSPFVAEYQKRLNKAERMLPL